MNTIKEAAGDVKNPQSVGRITPVNMQSEMQNLNSASLMRDMAKSGNAACRADCDHCPLWA